MTFTPYLNFSGNAEDALDFYKEVFGGTTEVMRWGDMPPDPKMPLSDDWKNKVMHGSLTISDGLAIYLADSLTEQKPSEVNRVHIHIEFDSEEDLRKVFDALVDGGAVNMPVEKTFWGAIYGDLVDKFGVSWGCHHQLPE